MKSLFSILVFFACIGLQSAMACVGCRAPGAMIEEQTVQAGIGFSWGVLIMLAVVFSLFSSLVWYIVQSCRRLDRQHALASRNSRK